MDKRTFIDLVKAGEPLIKQAIDAMRKFHDAEAAGLAENVRSNLQSATTLTAP